MYDTLSAKHFVTVIGATSPVCSSLILYPHYLLLVFVFQTFTSSVILGRYMLLS